MLQYYAESWSERYEKNLIAMEEEEAKKTIKCEALTDVVSVIVHPMYPLREGVDPNCYIYGDISVKVGQSNDPVKLFHRTIDNPAHVVLEDHHRNFLSLPDGVDPPPALEAVSRAKSNPILVTMKLYEKKSSGEDEPIAEVTDFEYASNVEGRCSYFHFDGIDDESKFCFQVCYAVMWGARAEIEVKINPPPSEEEGEGSILGECKPPVSISAKIAVVQNLLNCSNCCCGQTIRTLYDGSEEVHIGAKLKLQRSVFGLPLAKNQYLTIVVTPATVQPKKPLLPVKEQPVLVDFPIKLVSKDSFVTNKELTYTKDVPGTLFSVSIRILPLAGF